MHLKGKYHHLLQSYSSRFADTSELSPFHPFSADYSLPTILLALVSMIVYHSSRWIARESISFASYLARTINQRWFRNRAAGWLVSFPTTIFEFQKEGRKKGKGNRAQVSRIWIGIPPAIERCPIRYLIMPRSRRSVHKRARWLFVTGGTRLLARK